jgi:predicted nuclease with TOPRIM domain
MDAVLVSTISTALGSIATWFVARRKRNNDFIAELQASIDLLAKKNNEQLAIIVELREKLAQQHVELLNIKKENELLKTEVRKLNKNWQEMKRQ